MTAGEFTGRRSRTIGDASVHIRMALLSWAAELPRWQTARQRCCNMETLDEKKERCLTVSGQLSAGGTQLAAGSESLKQGVQAYGRDGPVGCRWQKLQVNSAVLWGRHPNFGGHSESHRRSRTADTGAETLKGMTQAEGSRKVGSQCNGIENCGADSRRFKRSGSRYD